jgi:hypothetical protein
VQVFYFASAALKVPQAMMGANITGLGEITNKLLASPDLVYMACEWSEAEKTAWLSKRHEERLYRLNAQSGLIPHDAPVIPITIEAFPETVPSRAFANPTAMRLSVGWQGCGKMQ